MGIFSSAIQFNYSSAGDLLLHYSPRYLSSVFLFVIGLPLAYACGSLIKEHPVRFSSLLYLLGFTPLALGLYLATGSYTLDFSKDRAELVTTSKVFFIKSVHTYPLSTIDHAEVQEDDGNSHMLYIALNSGDRVSTGAGWMPGHGYFQAANAINTFLAQNRAGIVVNQPATADIEKLKRQAIESTMQSMRDNAKAPVQPSDAAGHTQP